MTRYLIPPTPAEDLPAPPPTTAQDFSIPDEAFGARTLFGSLEPGEQLDPGYWDEANRANSTRAAELQNQFLDRQREILHTGPDAYLNKTGRDAVLTAPDVLSQLEAARRETIGQAANDAQRRLLTSTLGEHRITEHYRVGTHAGEQSLEWQKQTATERLNQLRQQAALDYTDPGSIEAYARASESAARERARTLKFGKDSDEAQAETDAAHSSIWRSAIEAALAANANKQAITLFDRAGDRLAPNDALILSRYVDDARELETGRDYVVRLALPEDTQPAPFDLAKILAQLGKAYDAATAQNNVDWPDDPSQRDTNQHLIDFTFGQKRHEALRADADLDQSINDWLDKRDVHDGPQVQRPSFALWASLDPERRRRIDDALRQNVSKSADPAQAREPSAPSVTRSGSDGHLGRELLQSTMDVVPGAHYAKLARQAFDAGDPTAVAIYGAASLLDAFVGVATLGFGTEISSAVRTAVGAAQGALKGVLHGSAATLEKAAAIAASRIKRLPSGRFSIIDWKGYPEYLPRPAGPFRLIEGSEYKVARDVAHKVNRTMRNAEQSLQGKHVHEIHPVKFGGNPIDPANKVGLTPQQHYETSAWWFKLQRQMEKAK